MLSYFVFGGSAVYSMRKPTDVTLTDLVEGICGVRRVPKLLSADWNGLDSLHQKSAQLLQQLRADWTQFPFLPGWFLLQVRSLAAEDGRGTLPSGLRTVSLSLSLSVCIYSIKKSKYCDARNPETYQPEAHRGLVVEFT